MIIFLRYTQLIQMNSITHKENSWRFKDVLKVEIIPFSLHISTNYKGSFLFNLEIDQAFYNRVNTPRENFFKENTRCKENVPTRRYIDRTTFNSYYVRFLVSKV